MGMSQSQVIWTARQFHLSIHYLHTLSIKGCRQAGAKLGERRGSPWAGRQSVTGLTQRQTTNQTHSCLLVFRGPVELSCTALNCEMKPKETLKVTKRKKKSPSWPWCLNSGASCCETTVLTLLPCAAGAF